MSDEITPKPPEEPTPLASPDPAEQANREVEWQMHKMSRRGFLWGLVALASAGAGYQWLRTRETNNGVLWPLRRSLELNDRVAESYFRGYRLAPEFDKSQIHERRNGKEDEPDVVNGREGLGDEVDAEVWRLKVEGLHDMSRATTSEDDPVPAVVLTLADIKALPKVTMVTELKCIEGWSIIVQWTGARFADFAAKYGPATKSGKAPDVPNRPEDILDYVAMETPDGAYYVGLDRESALHPQTLLCYEMNGQPLTSDHGAPLRLAIPVKYGVKNIKRIGTIRFTAKKPKDYWAERGYDWYDGH